MGSTTNFELTFNQAEVRSDGAHTNATTQQPATGGGGGGTVNSVGAGTNVTITGTAINPIVNVPTIPYADVTGAPTSLPPNGSAGGDLTGTYPNPTVNLLSAVTSILQTPVGYATGGNVQIRFDLGSYGNVGLTVNASFSPSGSGGLAAGRWQTLDLTNTTGGALTLTWNASWKLANGALPTTIAGGASYRIELRCGGSTEASVLASWEQTASAGLTVPASAVLLSSTTSTLLANLNDYNVQAYGAGPSVGAAANVTAINTAIAAMNAAGGGRLVFQDSAHTALMRPLPRSPSRARSSEWGGTSPP